METIILGGGCFWCMEAVFQMVRGVVSVESGYAGGHQLNPTYEAVSLGSTGHAEVIKINFNPTIISLEQVLAVFFTTHDPTTVNRQGNDVGDQYRSAIFYTSSVQDEKVVAYVNKLKAQHIFSSPIVTEIKPLNVFYSAERYHQNYYRNNVEKAYCQAIINPKLKKLRESYRELLRAA